MLEDRQAENQNDAITTESAKDAEKADETGMDMDADGR